MFPIPRSYRGDRFAADNLLIKDQRKVISELNELNAHVYHNILESYELHVTKSGLSLANFFFLLAIESRVEPG
jgi:hypothetical protein